MSLISCTLHGQQHIAQWHETHPEWTVARWTCGYRARQRRHLSAGAVAFAPAAAMLRPDAEGGAGMSLKGKVAVVTGSNSGIGLGIAEALARAGADVALNSFTDRPEDHALAERIAAETGVRAVYVRADMANGDDCRGLVAEAAADARPRRHPRQQRRHPARRADPGLPARDLGPHPRDQPLLGLPHHRRGAAADARAGLGPHRQHRLGARPDRLAVQVGLRRRQARHRRLHQGDGARDRRGADHRQRHLPRLRADPARRGADPRHHEAVRHGPRAR